MNVQVDVARSKNAVQANMEHEFRRNKERFAFLKWGSKLDIRERLGNFINFITITSLFPLLAKKIIQY